MKLTFLICFLLGLSGLWLNGSLAQKPSSWIALDEIQNGAPIIDIIETSSRRYRLWAVERKADRLEESLDQLIHQIGNLTDQLQAYELRLQQLEESLHPSNQTFMEIPVKIPMEI